FPGETEREFEELLAFLNAAELDRVGCFAYSPVDGAAANSLPDALPDEVREERRARLMATQAQISARRLQAKVGSSMTVLIDSNDGKRAIGRSTADAPEIDGTVIVDKPPALSVGSFVKLRIVGAREHDLIAVAAD